MKRLSKKYSPKLKKSNPKASRHYNQKFTYIWQIFFYTFLSILLIRVFICNGWEFIAKEDITILGNSYFDEKTILNASGINYPVRLLLVNPKKITNNLISQLSLESASVNRQIISKKISITVLERDPIAYAQRTGGKGLEKGMIDKDAIWIPFIISPEKIGKEVNLEIEGWLDEKRNWISLILLHRKNLGTPLKRIILSPNGETTLQTEEFKLIRLGSNKTLFKQQIRILAHLRENIPSDYLNQTITTIDLRDPSKPQLQTQGKSQ
tara:strand:+ start:654 stop:1451 length:798 start_codon:yes stop_codon:yes gene_type:complete